MCGTCEDDRDMVNCQIATQQDSKPAWTNISAGSNIHQNVKKKVIWCDSHGQMYVVRVANHLLLKASGEEEPVDGDDDDNNV